MAYSRRESQGAPRPTYIVIPASTKGRVTPNLWHPSAATKKHISQSTPEVFSPEKLSGVSGGTVCSYACVCMKVKKRIKGCTPLLMNNPLSVICHLCTVFWQPRSPDSFIKEASGVGCFFGEKRREATGDLHLATVNLLATCDCVLPTCLLLATVFCQPACLLHHRPCAALGCVSIAFGNGGRGTAHVGQQRGVTQ